MTATIAVPESAVRASREASELAAAHLVAGHRFIDEPATRAVVAAVGDGFRVICRSGHVSDVLWCREVAEGLCADLDAAAAI